MGFGRQTSISRFFVDVSMRNLAAVSVLGVLASLLDTLSVEGAAIDYVQVLREFQERNCTALPQDWTNNTSPCNWTGITCSHPLGEITGIDLKRADCSGAIPRGIANITSLRTLILSYNNFTGEFPAYLVNLTNLTHLDLAVNRFYGALPSSIGDFQSLELLNVSNNNFTGEFPSDLVKLRNLKYVRLGRNQMHGPLPVMLYQMEMLEELNVSGNHFIERIPVEYGQFQRIKILDLSRNDLRGDVPKELGNLATLVYLDLNSNSLAGPLPSEIGNLRNLSVLGLRNNTLKGPIPKSLGQLKSLTKLYLRWNMFEGCIPEELGNLGKLIDLYIQDNRLRGEIPESLKKLTLLRKFDVSANNLDGNFPQFFGNFKDLALLNLSQNRFKGSIPKNLVNLVPPVGKLQELILFNNTFSGNVPDGLHRLFNFSYSNNKDLCGNSSIYLDLRECKPGTWKRRLVLFISVSVTGVVIAAGIVVIVGSKIGRKTWNQDADGRAPARSNAGGGGKDRDNTASLTTTSMGYQEQMPEVPIFKSSGIQYTYDQLHAATSNFTEVIGKGGYGPVYKAVFPDGVVAAVKSRDRSSKQGDHEFITEIELLGRLHHKKLVNLMGYCIEGTSRMLVYEFKSNGCLHSHLHGENAQQEKITWPMRMKIIMDVAEGIQYLHHGADPSVIHRDIKSANILLDDNFNAFIADFGISREGPLDAADVKTINLTSTVKGTPGYLDPEYFYTHKLTRKSDVYSFGVFLLEVVTGESPTSTRFVNLSELGRSFEMSDNFILDDFMDPSLCGQYDSQQACRVVKVASKCVDRDVAQRPNMKVALGMLVGQIPLDVDVGTMVGTTDDLELSKSAAAKHVFAENSEEISDACDTQSGDVRPNRTAGVSQTSASELYPLSESQVITFQGAYTTEVIPR